MLKLRIDINYMKICPSAFEMVLLFTMQSVAESGTEAGFMAWYPVDGGEYGAVDSDSRKLSRMIANTHWKGSDA
jgi:hypothetical protein